MLSLDISYVRALRQRDAAAFEALVRAFLPRVRRVAMQYFQSPFEQEDAVQEAFTHLYAHLDAVDPMRAESLPGWVVTTARNRILDLARQKRPEVHLEMTEALGGDEAPQGPEAVVASELREVMAHFEEKLKPAYRPSFRAVFLEGLDWEVVRGSGTPLELEEGQEAELSAAGLSAARPVGTTSLVEDRGDGTVWDAIVRFLRQLLDVIAKALSGD